MLMNIKKVDGKLEYLIDPKGTKFMGSGKLGLPLYMILCYAHGHNNSLE